MSPAVPDGLTARPPTLGDAAAVLELIRADEREILGEAYVDLGDLLGHWQRPSFDLTEHAVAVFDGPVLAGYGEVFDFRRAEVLVASAYRGRGLGTALMRWTWELAAAGGSDLVGQTVPAAHRDARELLEAHAYRPLWTSWILKLTAGSVIDPPPQPSGVTLRPFVPGQDEHAAFRTIEDAFGEWPDRPPSTFEDWSATTLGRPDFQPWQLLLAVDGDDVVGACFLTVSGISGWVHQVAVRRDHRGRGLGRALLAGAFAITREHGAETAELSTDSRTGALGLYLHVGMQVTAEFVQLAKTLS